ncbi:MAG: aconitate hydratase B, partial [Candidatus Thiodiazotropha sp.]
MLEAYRQHVEERAKQGIPPLPLDAQQVTDLVELLKSPPAGEAETLLDLLTDRVPPGVDDAAYVKAGFLAAVAKGEAASPLIDKRKAVELLGTMLGGYNIMPMIDLLDDAELGELVAEQLKYTLLMFDAFHDVKEKADAGSANAKAVMQSWADAEWFKRKPDVPEEIKLTVFKVTSETNTDDLSPAQDAWSRPDIPLHALAMLKNEREGIVPDQPGKVGPISTLESLKEKGLPLAYVGDVVGTGSSRKSATNSVLWHMGHDIPHVPNKRQGGVVLGGKIAPIFFNTVEDSGALPIECEVDKLNMGDVIVLKPYAGRIENEAGELLSEFSLKTDVLLDEAKTGGRIPLIIGRSLTERAREALGLEPSEVFRRPVDPEDSGKGFTLAQKMVGKACGVEGIRPGTYCEPRMSTVGSQDTTGPMTRDELKELACLGFTADLVMQSFCHTAAYPKPVDISTQHTLPDFIQNRGGAALGVIPLDMPESVLVKFTGERQPGITLRDLVNAIPYAAIQRGLLTVEKQGKKNVYNGRILEIQGLPDLTVEQAFELSDASAERSAGGCTIELSE